MPNDSPQHAVSRDTRPRRPLRLCHVAYTFYETDNRVTRYAKALVERGDDVDVIALRRPGQPRVGEEHGVRVIRLQRRAKTESTPLTHLAKLLWFALQAFAVLTVRHLRRRYDIVQVHNIPDFLVFAALLPKLTGAKVILDIHDVLPELYAGKFDAGPDSAVFRALLLVERLSCKFADSVVVANHIWHERLVQRAASSAKCLTILNSPDLRLFKPQSRERTPPNGKFIILYPGSLSRHQGLDTAIRAFAGVVDLLPDAELHIYGEGPAKAELEGLTRHLAVEDRVQLHAPLPVEQIAEVIASAAVGIEPKMADRFGNEAMSTKVLEFLASGVPVILSRTRAHMLYFDHPSVRFFASGDHRELADALLDAYHHRPDDTSAQRAVEFASSYGWHRRVSEYYRLVESLSPIVSTQDAAATT